jgi:hypothetical protein
MKKILLITLILFATSVFAVPSIRVAGVKAIHQDASMIIRGDGFGNKDVASPILWDSVSNQSVYSDLGLEDGDIVPSQLEQSEFGIEGVEGVPFYNIFSTYHGRWYYRDDSANSRYLGQKYYSFIRKAAAEYENYDCTTLLVNWWFYVPVNIYDGSNKYIRIWQDSGGLLGRSSWTSHHLTYDCDTDHDGTPNTTNCADWGPSSEYNIGEWNNLQIVVAGEDLLHGYYYIETKINNTIIHPQEDNTSVWATDSMSKIFKFGFDASVAANYEGVEFFLSEVYIDSTLSRVVIGDNSLYSDCTHTEIQIPTSWSRTNIQATLNLGAFTSEEDLWLFVIDSNNVPSSGYLIQTINTSPITEPKIWSIGN